MADPGEGIRGGAVVICIEKFAALNSIELSSFNRFCRRVQLAIAVGRCGRHVVGDVCGPRAINYGTPVVLLSGSDAKIFQDYQAPTEIFSLRPNSLDFVQIQLILSLIFLPRTQAT